MLPNGEESHYSRHSVQCENGLQCKDCQKTGNFNEESRVHVEPLRVLKQQRETIKEIFQGLENNDQTQHAYIVLSTLEVLNTHGLVDMLPVNEESDP